MSVIKKEDCYLGIRFWARRNLVTATPRFFVYRYVGFSPDNGLHYFQHINAPRVLVSANHWQLQAQLATGSIWPFCIDHQRIEEALKDAAVPVSV